MSANLQGLKDFLSRYSEVYRETFAIPPNVVVSIDFLGNNDVVYFKELAQEPSNLAVEDFWFNGITIRYVSAIDIGTGDPTFVEITESNYDQYITTTLHYVGPHLDLSQGEDGQQVTIPTFSAKGQLKVNDGYGYKDFRPGPDGYVLKVDSTEPNGVYWADPTIPDTDDPDLTWAGTWLSGQEYEIGDVVKAVDGNTYICKVSHQSTETPDNSPPDVTNWELFVPKGETGIQGDQGDQGDAGPAAINWKDSWNELEAYVIGDGVFYKGSSYRCVVDHTNDPPPGVSWELFAEGGERDAVSRKFVVAAAAPGDEICSHRVVIVNDSSELELANHNDVDHAFRIIGISATNGNVGQEIKVVMFGYMQCDNWNWIPGRAIYVADSGKMTQTPPTAGFLATVAKALSNTEINVGTYENPIIL